MSATVDARPRRNAAATARKLLECARERFARDGYDRTSIRDIAHDAGVDQALVIRYFGSKEKLFKVACLPEPKTYGIFSGPREELPERLIDWLIAIEGAESEGQFISLLGSNADQASINLLRERLDRFTNQLAQALGGPNAGLRADLITGVLLGIGVMRRIGRRPELTNRSAAELLPEIGPLIERLTRL